MTKPREWWIVDESTDASDKCERWKYGRFSTDIYNHLPEQFQLHVIEHSAYLSAKNACDEFAAKFAKYHDLYLDACRERDDWKVLAEGHLKSWHEEIQNKEKQLADACNYKRFSQRKIEAERDKYRAALERIVRKVLENGSGQDVRNIASEALKEGV